MNHFDMGQNFRNSFGNFSDLYKEVNGVRPRFLTEGAWDAQSEGDKEAIIDSLQEELNQILMSDEEKAAADIAAFLLAGAPDAETAKRWAEQAWCGQ